ncbi:MAG: hypothetical protein IK999_04180 [Ruminococcus sp.]|nr:hypothetical protein [Ruminococcus sp.]
MKANITNNKKNTTMRKIVPAAGMLSISAVMLATSTYAWFTMSREVEVKNIQMTATVPEDLQISLGEISGGSNSVNLATSTGFIANSTDNVANNPAEQDDDDPFDWSNTADISQYYDFGKLIPAGSTNGNAVFFTPDAAGVGKTLKATNASYQAASALTASNEDGTGHGSNTYQATAHIKDADNEATWGPNVAAGEGNSYTTASAYNNTNDDGYYIDIPVWLRTSSTEAPNVYVTGYIKYGNYTAEEGDTDDLYKAVRVAVLDGTSGAAAGGCIDLYDQSSAETATYPASQAAVTSLIDSGIADVNFNSLPTGRTDTTASALNSATSGANIAATNYGDVVVNKGATSIGTLPAKGVTTDGANADAQYGKSKKFVLRVWLEGDDQNCWNANAGQDWAISLKFMTSALPANNG